MHISSDLCIFVLHDVKNRLELYVPVNMMNSSTAIVEGKTVKVGDTVGFKSDVEQYGKITAITRGRFGGYTLQLENLNGFSGDYIGGRKITSETADRCWID